jgi:hypothetical protein
MQYYLMITFISSFYQVLLILFIMLIFMYVNILNIHVLLFIINHELQYERIFIYVILIFILIIFSFLDPMVDDLVKFNRIQHLMTIHHFICYIN